MADHCCPSTVAKDSGSSTPQLVTDVSKHVSSHPLNNTPTPNISYYTPSQKIPAGTGITHASDSKPPRKLFQPLKLRGLTLQNRILVSPMCQYSAQDGHLTDWHLIHLGGIMARGPGLTIVEATAVLPEGRISPEDSGLWQDSQIEPLRRIVEFAHSQGQHIAIQLAHAGRKASTVAPWIDRKAAAPAEVGGWPDNVKGANGIPFDVEHTCTPHTLTLADIQAFKTAFLAAVQRALKAGFDAIEIHAAHGYLLHAALSPATNALPEPYSGSLENRMRLLLELTSEIRAAIPEDMPLLVRVPGSDWVPEPAPSWKVGDCVVLSLRLAELGVDFIDVSSAGLMHNQKVISGPSYQVPFAAAVKEALIEAGRGDVAVGTVGMITSGVQAEGILDKGEADAVLVARAFLKNPGLVWEWAGELGVEVRMANQIGWGFGQRPQGGVKAVHAASARG